MKNREYIIIFFFLFINLFFTNNVFAVELILNPSKEYYGTGEQFYVDLNLDPKGESINTISGSVSFSNNNISFLRAEEGKSMVNLWVEKPKLNNNAISFAGIVSNGFGGVIDPFNPNDKLPGLVIRFIFETKHYGKVDFSTSTFYLNKNDGLGTEIKLPPTFKSININNVINKIKYENKTYQTPELEAYIIKDPNIFDNKFTLVFKATDKETGIKSVMIKEGRRDWREIESPYLLKDQSRHSTINLQAINFSGGGMAINIEKIPYNWRLLSQIMMVIVIIIISSIFIIKKIYAPKKQ